MKKIGIILGVLFLLWAHPAKSARINDLQGEPFSDPTFTVDMPEEWKQQPIKYDEWGQGADLVISANQHFASAIYAFAKEYEKKHGIEIALKDATCGVAMMHLKKKSVDITSFCCAPANTDRLPGNTVYTAGISPLGIFVNTKNPVNNITFEQAQKIFTGEIQNWSEIGGVDHDINRVLRLHCKKKPGLWRMLLKDQELFSFRSKDVSRIEPNLNALANDPFAIGFDNIWQIDNFDMYDSIKVLNINGKDPEDDNVLLTGDYPIYQTLSFFVWTQDNLKNPHAEPFLQGFIDWINNGNAAGELNLVSPDRLRKAGWKFKGYELIGEPSE